MARGQSEPDRRLASRELEQQDLATLQARRSGTLATPVVVFTQAPADSVSPRAKQLHDRAIVVDSHDDTTQRLIFDKALEGLRHNFRGIAVAAVRKSLN